VASLVDRERAIHRFQVVDQFKLIFIH
jgi:hypothetical protein